jgi:carbon storage regulator CsrA
MLVLSRRESEKVLFPTLGISVELLRVQGNKARLGIDAPPEIPVLRHELTERSSVELTPDGSNTRRQLSDLAHAVRRRLDSAAVALNELHHWLEAKPENNVSELVMRLYRDLESLEQEASQAIEWTTVAKTSHVLVVEDSDTERKLMAAVLEYSGLNVSTACDGQDALDFLSMHAKPDAVLLDMLMPRCDGPAFVREVRSDPQFADLKIFAVSSIEPATLGLATGSEGITGWFPKPLEPAELVSTLDQRLNESIAV